MLTLCNTIYLVRRRIYYTMRLLLPRGSITYPSSQSIGSDKVRGGRHAKVLPLETCIEGKHRLDRYPGSPWALCHRLRCAPPH